MGAGLQNTIVFCNAVTAAVMCAASKGKAAGQVCGRGLYSTADNIQLCRHGESGARYSAQTAAVSSSLYRHKAGERTTAGESGGIYSSAQEQEHKAATCIHNILTGLPAADTSTPTPGFGGGVKMKLCQRVEVILFRPFSQPSSKNFDLNEVSLFHELF